MIYAMICHFVINQDGFKLHLGVSHLMKSFGNFKNPPWQRLLYLVDITPEVSGIPFACVFIRGQLCI